MIPPVTLLATAALVVATTGVVFTRIWRARADKLAVRERLETLLSDHRQQEAPVLLHERDPDWYVELHTQSDLLQKLTVLIDRSGIDVTPFALAGASLGLGLLLGAIIALLGAPLFVAVLVGCAAIAVPTVVLFQIAEQKRMKFIEQLPDAIELMISVLRSGLSVPQAIKSVAEEIAAPCGVEFSQVLHRINLGQSLPEALQATSEKYQVFELDLLRRAAGIQAEVGGSLAELLDKTNSTLRQRIKLKRQVRTLTAQSRLSGTIIAFLPFVVAIGFQMLNPIYLKPLYETNIGKLFVVLALGFQMVGVAIIRKLATFKV